MADSQLRRPTASPSDNPPSTTQLFPLLLTLLPIAAFLLFLAGISFIGTVVGLAVVSPLFVIFSPILVPAAVAVALAVAGFLTSGAFGVTALSSLSLMANILRRSGDTLQLQQAKQWVRETASHEEVQTKTEEVGPAQEGGRTEQGGQAQAKGTDKNGAAQEGSKAQESGKAQEGEKAQGGKK
ncbi:oleosin 16.4 kDa-like [Cucurbita pepo subsp. pepo]|uniref:oleosin 16.4 kDa-like n=1 Tax=Cucurbita pepo subsp. pepo TaxID=3664 RepID=UPI000C9D7D65|nr:oleosin 16.4 kDa-like [Cucurbita pepo subsp. pepo]